MKGTNYFKATIKNYLDKRAQEDELFRSKYETTNRTIDDVVTYILYQIKASGCEGFADDEIYSMAIHVIDEPTLEIKNRVVQSRGLCNKNTDYLDRIVNLVNANAHRFIKARATA